MLNLYQSNRLEALVAVLSQQLKNIGGSDPLASDVVLVQSPGMSQWLKLEIAEQNGIAANLEFPLPSSFIWGLYQNALNNVPKLSPFNKDRMSWKLYQILPDLLQDEAFSRVREYLKPQTNTAVYDGGAPVSELRLFQLAEKIADVFDNYLMYRPHWLEYWQLGENSIPDESEVNPEPWQAILWRALYRHSLAHNTDIEPDSPLHRADMQAQLLTALAQASRSQINHWLPSRLFVFGISTMPKSQFQVLQAIGQHIDVEILWLNPCCQYWGDILSEQTLARLNAKQRELANLVGEDRQNYFVSGNPLLASLGKVGRDYLELLHTEEVNMMDLFIEPSGVPSVLLQIQQDILDLKFRGSQTPLTPMQLHSDYGKRTWPMDDDSVRVHSCHSVTRELEVLKDQLLAWFDSDADLTPKDVLVMMPDVEQYAPYIDSVFCFNPKQETSFIPYTIADRSGFEQHPILNTFVQLLLLPTSRFAVSELLDYLDVPQIMVSFDLEPSDVALLKQWILECQIKWGQDGQHKSQWDLPINDLNTWCYGLKRMVLGVALGDDELWQDILAYPKIEGLSTQVLGKLLTFFSFLLELKTELSKQRSLEQWQSLLSALISRLFDEQQAGFDDNSETQYVVQQLRDSVQGLVSYAQNGDFSQEVDHHIVHRYFSQAFDQSGVTQRFLAGKMNFCTLMPMRSVPFKIIAILGLNEGEYPRQVEPVSFDLVAHYPPRKGDRSRKLDDRYLFLEALTSAREKLHLSFIGQSQKTNESLVPSLILEELIDYLEQSYIVDNASGEADLSDHYVIKHKLQPFDLIYFSPTDGSSPYFSYSETWWSVVQQQLKMRGSDPQECKDDLKKDLNVKGLDPDGADIRSELEPNDRLEDPVYIDDFLEFWRHPIKHFYRQGLDINLDLNLDSLSDHEVFQHDGLEQYKRAEELLSASLYGDSKDTNRLLRSGDYPIALWGQTMLESYLEKNARLIDTIGALTGQQNVTLTHDAVSLSLDYGDLKLNVEGDIELINGCQILLRNGKLRPLDQLKAYLLHLLRAASLGTEPTAVLTNDAKAAYFTPLSKEESIELLGPWLRWYVTSRSAKVPMLWHISPALAWTEAKQKGDSPWQLHKALLATVEPNGFSRTLADDPYASKHLTSLDDFTQEFYEFSESQLPPMLSLLTVAKPEKAIAMWQESDLTEVN